MCTLSYLTLEQNVSFFIAYTFLLRKKIRTIIRYEGSDLDSMEEGFDIFTKPSRNASNYIFNDYIVKPTHPISRNDFNPIFLDVENSDSRFWTMPNSIRIHLEAKETLQDRSPISPSEKISLQDLVCHSLFQQIEIRINIVPISDNATSYLLRAISHCIYSFQTDSKKTLLPSEGFFRDEYKNENEDVYESSNGFTTRVELINKNGAFHAHFYSKNCHFKSFKIFPSREYSNFEIHSKF